MKYEHNTYLIIIISIILLLSICNYRSFLHTSTYQTYSLSKINEQHTTTIVTAYFPLEKSKYSQDKYHLWLKNFLGFCHSPMIIYTSNEHQPILQQLRHNGSLITHFITTYNSPFGIPLIKSFLPAFNKEYETDSEKMYHSVELYAIWAAKSFLLNQSAQLNPFQTKYFLYVDAGVFRSSAYRFQKWPHKSAMDTIFKDDRLLFSMINTLPRQFCSLPYQLNRGPVYIDLIQGGIMGGTLRNIQWWTSLYYDTILDYISRNAFIGKDQHVMNALVLAHPYQMNILLSFRTPCGSSWHAFGPLLANENEKQNLSYSMDCQRHNLSGIIIPLEKICLDPKNFS
ncbi:hypothetical protein I4U23_022854 [Adineta vaga]|nr:hypothetical protein I4U23_022854 [Adineta vaga]